IESVEVEIDLSLPGLSDGDAARIWGRRLAEAINDTVSKARIWPASGKGPVRGPARRDPKKPAADPKSAPGEGLGDWGGVGKPGKIFTNRSEKPFVDKPTRESVPVHNEWPLADFKSYEPDPDAVMELDRVIRIELATGTAVLVRSRARSWFFADRLP